MRFARFVPLLLASLFVAGCTFPWQNAGGDPPPDKSAYHGGPGVALALRNNGTDPFDAVVRLVGVGNAEIGRIEQTFSASDSVERWWSAEPSIYSARLTYTWTSPTGGTSSGEDDVTVDLQDCAGVVRIAWALVQDRSTVGSQRIGNSCEPAE